MILMEIQCLDRFDPTSSIDSNEGPACIKTVIFLFNIIHKNDGTDAYTISFGYKGYNHDQIEKMFIHELTDIGSEKSNMSFSRGLNKEVMVVGN